MRADKPSVLFVSRTLKLAIRWLGWFVGVNSMRYVFSHPHPRSPVLEVGLIACRLVSRSGGIRRVGGLVLRISYKSDLDVGLLLVRKWVCDGILFF
jgi:hypothetical protein